MEKDTPRTLVRRVLREPPSAVRRSPRRQSENAAADPLKASGAGSALVAKTPSATSRPAATQPSTRVRAGRTAKSVDSPASDRVAKETPRTLIRGVLSEANAASVNSRRTRAAALERSLDEPPGTDSPLSKRRRISIEKSTGFESGDQDSLAREDQRDEDEESVVSLLSLHEEPMPPASDDELSEDEEEAPLARRAQDSAHTDTASESTDSDDEGDDGETSSGPNTDTDQRMTNTVDGAGVARPDAPAGGEYDGGGGAAAPAKASRGKAAGGLSEAIVRRVFGKLPKGEAGRSILRAVARGTDKFIESVAVDLIAYANHAHRHTIEFGDVECLMRRQGLVDSRAALDTLIRTNLPLEYVEELIPVARARNAVQPKR
eukprot:Opistho-2@74919